MYRLILKIIDSTNGTVKFYFIFYRLRIIMLLILGSNNNLL